MAKGPTQRMTQQREVILDVLRSTHSHPTADEVYAMVRKRLPRVSLGTIYRNLDRMCESGDIRKIETCGAQKRFDGNAEVHYHVRCLECCRIDDVPIKPSKRVDKAAMEQTGYQILGHKILFLGFCPKCKRKIHSSG